MDELMIPIPDAIREDETGKDRTFLFDPGPPNINLKERTMTAPVQLSERTRQLQLRELAHAKWSPENMRVGGINQTILDAVEHNRLTHHLLINGFDDLDSRIYNDLDIKYMIEYGDVARAAAMLISTINTADGKTAERLFTEKYGLLGNAVTEALAQFDLRTGHELTWINSFSWEEATAAASRVQKLLRDYTDARGRLKEQPPAQMLPHQPSDEAIAGSITKAAEASGVGGRYWTEMELQEPPRPISLPPELMARKTIKSDMGAVPIAMHRAMIDGRVFREKRRKRGAGSVLIDQSGSMSLVPEDMERVMEILPGVVIGTYCSHNRRGFLRILAKGGKRVEPKDLLIGGGGNGCDGPALRWLEAQPAPRFWVSDGMATAQTEPNSGTETLVSTELRRELVDSQLRGRILRVPDCSRLLLNLSRKKQRT